MINYFKIMINEKELRVGNLVKCKTYPGSLYSIRAVCEHRIHPIELLEQQAKSGYAVNLDGLSELVPILLTRKILKQCGFDVKVGTTANPKAVYSDFHKYRIYLDKKNNTVHFNAGEGWYPKFTSVLYLHQLQNLYYALTNKELIINL